jgi:hypothetical protein
VDPSTIAVVCDALGHVTALEVVLVHGLYHQPAHLTTAEFFADAARVLRPQPARLPTTQDHAAAMRDFLRDI